MTISSDKNRWSYVGDGATTSFDYRNRIFAETDLKVYVDSVLQTVNTDYTVSGVGGETGGTVALTLAPQSAAAIMVVRDVPKTQGTDLPFGGVFPATSVEDMADKTTVLAQQNADKIARALVVGDSDPNSFGAMPLLSTFFSKYLAFDGSGNPTPGVSLTGQVVTYTADTFSGDNSTVAFTLSLAPASTAATAVFISGVRQTPVTDYAVSGTTLTFVSAPPTGAGNILVVFSQAFAGTPADGSITTVKLAATAVTSAKIALLAITEGLIGADAVNWLTKIKAATAADLPHFDASGDPALLAKGTGFQQLRMNSGATLPEWFTPPFKASFESAEQTITSAGSLTLAHSLSAQPKLYSGYWKCQTAEHGYSIGDEILAEGALDGGTTGARGVTIVPDATNLNIRFASDTNLVLVRHKTTGVGTNATTANWKLIARAWA